MTEPSNQALAIQHAEARGYQRGLDEGIARGLGAIGDLWSELLKPLFGFKRALDHFEFIHEGLFDTVEGREGPGGPGLGGLPHETWTNVTGSWAEVYKRLGHRSDEIYKLPTNADRADEAIKDLRRQIAEWEEIKLQPDEDLSS